MSYKREPMDTDKVASTHLHCALRSRVTEYLWGRVDSFVAQWGECTHPVNAETYQELKISLSEWYKNYRVAYIDGKTEFINRIVENARKTSV
jgi:hypothetical protein